MSARWPAAREELFRQLWAEGVSTKAIARQFGLAETSITSKRVRMGLPERMQGNFAQPQVVEDPDSPRMLLAGEWQMRGLDQDAAMLRVSLLTARGAAHELRRVRGARA